MVTCCGGIEMVNGKCSVCGDKEDTNIHRNTAKKVFGVTSNNSKDQAKSINFVELYKRVLKYRIIVYGSDNSILDIYEFEARQRKDGLSKPLCDMLWNAFEAKPEGGKVEVDKFFEGER